MSLPNPLNRWRYAVCALVFALSACGGPVVMERGEIPKTKKGMERATTGDGIGSLLGEGGVFGGDESNTGGSGGVGVNSYLWRASLDTISFMPVTSVDPFGGVIITDWHSSAESLNERFKLNVYILGRQLRADGVRVSVFRQVLQNQIWRDAEISSDTAIKIEDAILTRARQLRHQLLGQQ